MVAAAPSTRTVRRVPWPPASARTRAAWATRHVVHMALTIGYTETQARMLFLADVDPHDRFATFERECLQRCLAPTTALTYWTAWISAAAALALPTDVAADTRTMRLLKSRATRFPVAFPPPMTVLEVQQLLAQRRSTITTLIVTSWTLGQRISDTLQWAATDLHEETPSGTLIVTVRRGKTMSVSPPYVLALPAGPLTEALKCLKRKCTATKLFLFTDDNSPRQRDVVKQLVAETLTAIREDLELRSVRRGGLQQMAALGFTFGEIMLFSRHASEDMLRRYLNWGATSTALLSTITNVSQEMSQALTW
jgi:integrase